MADVDVTTKPPHFRRVRDRALSDLIIGVALVASGSALFISLDATEWLAPRMLHWEAAELDDLLLSFGLAVAVACWFSLRRFFDSRAQVAELERNARERTHYMKRLEDLSSQLLDAEARERDRIADVLHDEIGQTLYACQLKLDLAEVTPSNPAIRALLAQAKQLTTAAMTRARDLSMQLSPPELHDLEIADAIQSLIPRLEDRYGLTMQFVPGPAWSEIRRAFYGPVFQSITELAVNAAKHGAASRVVLSAELDAEAHVNVVVADDGRGFDSPAAKTRGFGLFSVERRLACIAGALEIRSSAESGTTATLRLPTTA